MTLTIGTATAKQGEIVTGWLDAVTLPTGGTDRFPIIIAQGANPDGPVFWVTASIHGGEHTGLIVAQQLVTPELLAEMRGTLVVVPTLNPAGLRTKERSPYYYGGDPNRLFPEPRGSSVKDDEENDVPPAELELAYRNVYNAIKESRVDFLLDLHTAYIGSLPMVFRDPIFYHRSRKKGLLRHEAEALQKRVGDMMGALGLTIVNEFVADSYVEKNLHRSVSGAVLNGLGVPAATIELGSWMHVDNGVVNACLAGLRNVMRWGGMLSGEMEPVTGVPIIKPGFPIRRHLHPYAPKAGIVHHITRVGEKVEKGQPLARLTDIFGSPVEGDGLLRSEFGGYVLAWQHGVVRFQGEPVMMLGVKDNSELVIPYPS